MGVTIHYRGRLNDVGQIDALCDELADIAKAMGWQTMRRDDDWDRPADARLRYTPEGASIEGHLGLKGIQLTPTEDAESLPFFFDAEGNLRSPMTMVLLLDGTLEPGQAWVSVKTQFASAELHVWIVGLLKYLNKRYLSDLEVSDEGRYWETGDVRILKEKMDFLGRKIDQLSSDLSSGRWGDFSELSVDQIADSIELWFHENEGGTTE